MAHRDFLNKDGTFHFYDPVNHLYPFVSAKDIATYLRKYFEMNEIIRYTDGIYYYKPRVINKEMTVREVLEMLEDDQHPIHRGYLEFFKIEKRYYLTRLLRSDLFKPHV